jgi:CCR4-NOT transcription complex subunit 10
LINEDPLFSQVIIAAAYVSLRLYNPRIALEHCNHLLEYEPYLSPAHRLLAHSYAAEALVLEDRLSEAMQHLVPDHVSSSFSTDIPNLDIFGGGEEAEMANINRETASKHGRKWFPNNSSTAKVVVQYNRTVAHSFLGELEEAGDCLKQLSKFKEPNTEIPIQAMMMALYIQVQLGHTDIARKIIKQHCPQLR